MKSLLSCPLLVSLLVLSSSAVAEPATPSTAPQAGDAFAAAVERLVAAGRPAPLASSTAAVESAAGSSPEAVGPILAADGTPRLAVFTAVPTGGDPDAGSCLWRSDGTPAGTYGLGPRRSCLQVPRFPGLAWGPDLLFFFADASLWRTDGTPDGTFPLLPAGTPFGRSGNLAWSAPLGALLFEAGAGLWASDGSAAGTRELGVLPGVAQGYADLGHASYLTVSSGTEDWLIRADDAGLTPVTALAGADLGPFPRAGAMRTVGSRAVFPLHSPNGKVELWATDGTAAGTVPLRLFDDASRTVRGVRFARAGGLVWFAADEGAGLELWRTDGTAAGTLRVSDLPGADPFPRSFPTQEAPTTLGALTFFIADGGPAAGTEPWRTDGTAAGTAVMDLCPGACSSSPQNLLQQGGRLLFTATSTAAGREPWVSDGTVASSRPAADLCPGPCGSDGLWIAGTDGAFGFVDDGIHGAELWHHAPPAGVPQRLTDYPGPRPFGDVFDQVVLDGGLVFAADDGSHGREPWWSDGTAGGTRLLADVAGGPAGGACVADASTLCLGEGRFRVTVDWHNQHAPVGVPDTGVGGAISAAGEDDSGFFWFFRPDNVELAVKVLDGRTANGYFWVFFGALSDVEYWVRVEDTVGGGERIYHNPPGRICGQSDTAAFPVGGPSAGGSIVGDGGAGLEPVPGDGLRLLTLDPPEPLSAADTAPVEPCPEGDGILCLLGGGLAVDVQWFVSRFGIGQGHAVPFTDRTGFFWFFRPGNVELVVKALDGRTVNGKIWVFYGALSDVSYSIRVVDRAGGGMRTYDNPQGNLCGRGDTAAF